MRHMSCCNLSLIKTKHIKFDKLKTTRCIYCNTLIVLTPLNNGNVKVDIIKKEHESLFNHLPKE